jgi:site-specific recombinase XerD
MSNKQYDAQNSILNAYRARLLAIERLSKSSVETYITEIKQFFYYLNAQNAKLENIDSLFISSYLAASRQK